MTHRARTTEIEAVQWSGFNWHSVLDFAGRDVVYTTGSDLFVRHNGVVHNGLVQSMTPDGDIWVMRDDWLVRAEGGIAVFDPGVFEFLYEPLEEGT